MHYCRRRKKSIETLTLIINNYCDETISILGTAENIAVAFSQIQTKKPDIVFLEIEMPIGSGFDLLRKFKEINFQIIFTTGFNQYAITAIKFRALDYLLKPINIIELKETLIKTLKNIDSKNSNENYRLFLKNFKKPKNLSNRIPLPVLDGLELVQINTIVYCQADEDYTYVFLIDGTKKVVTKSIKDFEELLEVYGFFRIHHS